MDLLKRPFQSKFLVTFFLALAFMPSSYAQFENEPVSVILDNTNFQFFSDFYVEDEVDFINGGSSLQVLPPPLGTSSPTTGLFVDGNRTIIFDYKYQAADNFENLYYQAFFGNGSNQLIRKDLAETGAEWCRESVYLPVGVNVFQWFAEIDSGSSSVIKFDNVQVENGQQTIPAECAAAPPPEIPDPDPEPVSITSIIGLLLDESTPVAPPTPGSFSGQISLSMGVFAGAGGVTLEVKTNPIEFDFSGFPFKTTAVEVTIPSGQNATNYQIDLFENPSFNPKGLEFECLSGCDDLDVTTGGFWSETIGVTGFFYNTEYDHFQDHDVDIQLEPADVFKGSISLPSGLMTTGSEFVVVRVSEVGPLLFSSFVTYISPTAGLTSFPFTVGAPSDSIAANWAVEVSCLSCDASISIATQHVSAQTGGILTTNSAGRFLFAPDMDHSGIDVELLEVP